MWQATYKASKKTVDKLLTDEQKATWEKHPATKGLFKYKQVATTTPKQTEVQEPLEAKKYEPKSSKS